jgi:L-ascorbate metabolism protein UlaG (beta-lactamase superfamily)
MTGSQPLPDPSRDAQASPVTSVTYVGHATALVVSDGVRILTDPVFGNRAGPLRAVARTVDPAWAQDVDAVLLSHLHRDHFDVRTLRALGRPLLIAPAGASKWLRRHGFAEIEELQVDESTNVGEVTVRATHAAHGRVPERLRRSASVGFVIEGRSTTYFAGDTDLFPGMAEIAQPLDLALLPIWGWGPRLGAGHLDPLRAAQALELLHPRIAIPIHWGTFHLFGAGRLSASFLRVPPLEFVAHARRLAPEVDVRVLALGESLTFG